MRTYVCRYMTHTYAHAHAHALTHMLICAHTYARACTHTNNYVSMYTYVTGPAKIDHVSAIKSPIFSVFAIS